MQEVITFLIVGGALSYVAFKLVMLFVNKSDASSCESTGCPSCGVRKNCTNELKINS